jgi:hypothetical protein
MIGLLVAQNLSFSIRYEKRLQRLSDQLDSLQAQKQVRWTYKDGGGLPKEVIVSISRIILDKRREAADHKLEDEVDEDA